MDPHGHGGGRSPRTRADIEVRRNGNARTPQLEAAAMAAQGAHSHPRMARLPAPWLRLGLVQSLAGGRCWVTGAIAAAVAKDGRTADDLACARSQPSDEQVAVRVRPSRPTERGG